MSGQQLYSGICWYDGDLLELEQSDGTRVDISRFTDLVERPVTGHWANKYPEAEYYIEAPEDTEQDGAANPAKPGASTSALAPGRGSVLMLGNVMRSPFIAWLKSLPGALLGPVGMWLLFGLVVIGSEPYSTPLGGLGFGLYAGILGLMVHAASYLLFGLPVFLMCYSRPEAAIWKPGWSMTAGVVLGALPFVITGQVMPAPIGMAYGAWTTLFAWRQRPRKKNHEVETTPIDNRI